MSLSTAEPGPAQATLLGIAIIALTCWPVLRYPQLEPDDYRYLESVQSLEAGFFEALPQVSVVENRWDHLWWIDTDEAVRFFRPIIVLSYWLDKQLWGDSLKMGLLVTNLLIYAACVGLASWLFFQWLGRGAGALVASAAFAALHCHGEVIWYVAGRTDTLAALGFLAALALHLARRRHRWLSWAAVLCFGLGSLSKEQVLVFPAVCLLHDLSVNWRQQRVVAYLRSERWLYSSYAVCAVAVLVVRRLVLGSHTPSFVFPYLVSPLRPDFPAHVWTQFRSYGENLLMARTTPPFLQPSMLGEVVSIPGLLVMTLVAVALLVALRREPRFWFFCAFAVLTWAPTAVVYTSERYLLLPSVAVAGAAGLLLQHLSRRRGPLVVGAAVLSAWVGWQAWQLGAKNLRVMRTPREAEIVERQLAGVAADLRRGATLLTLNLPGRWLHAQFIRSQMRVLLEDPDLDVAVLTVMPADELLGAGLRLERRGPDRLVVEGGTFEPSPRPFPLLTADPIPFPAVSLAPGRRYAIQQPRLQAETLVGEETIGRRLAFRFPLRLEEYEILVWSAQLDPQLSRLERIRRGNLHRMTLDSPAGRVERLPMTPSER